MDAETFWEHHYSSHDRVWSGRPNPVLVEVVEPVSPGTALDLGSGEGGDAVWLASRGWDVTAVDVSATALARTAARAEEAGVAARVRGERHDLGRSFPAGSYDLVSAQYLQSPAELPRERVLRAAAGAVAPGGLLLVVEHGAAPPWAEGHRHADFATPEELLATLALAAAAWDVERIGAPEREAVGPAGQRGTLRDTVVAVRRRPTAGAGRPPLQEEGGIRLTADDTLRLG